MEKSGDKFPQPSPDAYQRCPFLHQTILLGIHLATVIRVVKHPFIQTDRLIIFLAVQIAVNNGFSWPDIATELNSTGRSSDKLPHPSLDVYK